MKIQYALLAMLSMISLTSSSARADACDDHPTLACIAEKAEAAKTNFDGVLRAHCADDIQELGINPSSSDGQMMILQCQIDFYSSLAQDSKAIRSRIQE